MKIKHKMFMSLFYKDTTLYKELFGNNVSFNSFEYRLKKISKNNAVLFGYAPGDDGENKMKGDLFEIFIEIFIHLCGSHSSVCISSYEPIDSGSDNGVDGFGRCMRSNNLTVQIKFRSDISYELVEADLKQFWGQSICKYRVNQDAVGNLVIVTNCKGVNWYTLKEVLLERARVISRSDILSSIKNNNCFWDNLKLMMDSTFKDHLGDDFEYDWTSTL